MRKKHQSAILDFGHFVEMSMIEWQRIENNSSEIGEVSILT